MCLLVSAVAVPFSSVCADSCAFWSLQDEEKESHILQDGSEDHDECRFEEVYDSEIDITHNIQESAMDVDSHESFQAQDHSMDVDSTPIEDYPKLSNSRYSQTPHHETLAMNPFIDNEAALSREDENEELEDKVDDLIQDREEEEEAEENRWYGDEAFRDANSELEDDKQPEQTQLWAAFLQQCKTRAKHGVPQDNALSEVSNEILHISLLRQTNAPAFWRVKCKPGSEYELVPALYERFTPTSEEPHIPSPDGIWMTRTSSPLPLALPLRIATPAKNPHVSCYRDAFDAEDYTGEDWDAAVSATVLEDDIAVQPALDTINSLERQWLAQNDTVSPVIGQLVQPSVRPTPASAPPTSSFSSVAPWFTSTNTTSSTDTTSSTVQCPRSSSRGSETAAPTSSPKSPGTPIATSKQVDVIDVDSVSIMEPLFLRSSSVIKEEENDMDWLWSEHVASRPATPSPTSNATNTPVVTKTTSTPASPTSPSSERSPTSTGLPTTTSTTSQPNAITSFSQYPTGLANTTSTMSQPNAVTSSSQHPTSPTGLLPNTSLTMSQVNAVASSSQQLQTPTADPSAYMQTAGLIRSVLCVSGLSGWVYIEGEPKLHLSFVRSTPLMEFLRTYQCVRHSLTGNPIIELVSTHEMGQLLQWTPPALKLMTWVRVRKGLYTGDSGPSHRVIVLLIPRVSNELVGDKRKAKDTRGELHLEKVGQSLFTGQKNGLHYKNGLLRKAFDDSPMSYSEVQIAYQTRDLFSQSQHSLIKAHPLPVLSSWVFEPGEEVESLSRLGNEAERPAGAQVKERHLKNPTEEEDTSAIPSSTNHSDFKALMKLVNTCDEKKKRKTAVEVAQTETILIRPGMVQEVLSYLDPAQAEEWVDQMNLCKRFRCMDQIFISHGEAPIYGVIIDISGETCTVMELYGHQNYRTHQFHVNTCKCVGSRDSDGLHRLPWIEEHVSCLKSARKYAHYTGFITNVFLPKPYTKVEVHFPEQNDLQMYLKDILPLGPHQQQFRQADWDQDNKDQQGAKLQTPMKSLNTPWKNVQVIVIRGPKRSYQATVINVILSQVMTYEYGNAARLELDYSWIRDANTGQGLNDAYPLKVSERYYEPKFAVEAIKIPKRASTPKESTLQRGLTLTPPPPEEEVCRDGSAWDPTFLELDLLSLSKPLLTWMHPQLDGKTFLAIYRPKDRPEKDRIHATPIVKDKKVQLRYGKSRLFLVDRDQVHLKPMKKASSFASENMLAIHYVD
ncbi:hypothetical protein D9758_014235 [Tetrapyrgos nigripes]|uniref:Uncharacterized protein n=1 Tax=Tetrapyrgos nigripes TaxID=182062 RepID=A0A8H5CYL1_9AGAR|nr:hypothetical protein D9758_014235 [Tetrapyrgos nigripes]